jgi:O-acetylhomoserine/O-acetylserine sulfhydrylase-like pyridoxal-dependent enzyme
VPIHLSTTYAQHAPAELYNEFDYTRCGNPTRKAFEDCIAAVEYGTHGLAFASGCAAMTATLHLLNPGDQIIGKK